MNQYFKIQSKKENKMQKKDAKTREITFSSKKNAAIRSVHSKAMRTVAELLENDEDVIRYETGIEIDTSLISDVTGIRPAYLDEKWISDFRIYYEDGSVRVWEVLEESQSEKKSALEQLEVSRRFWKNQNVNDWNIILATGGETQW